MLEKSTQNGYLSDEDVFKLCSQVFSAIELRNHRVLVLIPEDARNASIGLLFELIYRLIGEKVKRLDSLGYILDE